MKINERIKKARLLCGLTQQDVANKVGCSRETVSRYEEGKQSVSEEMEQRIAGAVGLLIVKSVKRDKVE